MERYVYFLVFILILFSQEMLAQENHAEIVEAAQVGLQKFINSISPSDKGVFGFSESDNLEKVVLGAPYNLHTIKPNALENYRGGPLNNILSKTSQWYFPVILEGKAKSILVVDEIEGKWKAVSFGKYNNLTKALNNIKDRYPNNKCKIIAVFQAKQFLLTVPEVEPNKLITIPNSKSAVIDGRSVANNADELLMKDSFEVVENLKPIVSEAIKHSRNFDSYK